MGKRLKFLTCYEYVKIHNPRAIRKDYISGVFGCPRWYGLDNNCSDDDIRISALKQNDDLNERCNYCYGGYARKNNKYIAVIKE